MNQQQLTLVVPPSLEDALIDWLLDCPEVGGFTSMTGSGHGVGASSLSTAEQVTGRQRRTVLMLHVAADAAEGVLRGLGQGFAGADIHYWLTPVLDAGRLGGEFDE